MGRVLAAGKRRETKVEVEIEKVHGLEAGLDRSFSDGE
jgi:hypothetical protein